MENGPNPTDANYREIEMPPTTMYEMHPVDGMLRLLAIVDAIRDVLSKNGPTSRQDLHSSLWKHAQYTDTEIDAALCNVDYDVDKHDILSID